MTRPTHACVAAVLVRADRVLLCHRSPARSWFPNTWDLPGGHVETGERAPDALARELGEELGIAVVAPADVPFVTLTDPEADLRLDVWILRDWQGEPDNRTPDEHDQLEWFRRDEVDALEVADERYRILLDAVWAAGRPPTSDR